MGAFDHDTELLGGDGEWRAELSRDWEIWGPNGGYVAAIALRAAGCHTELRRPASFAGHFLGVAEFAEVTLRTRTLRRTRRAESIAVSITQGERPVHEAVVWVVGDVDGLRHESAPMPDVSRPEELLSMDARAPIDAPVFRFWGNLEVRPVDWIEDWEGRPAGETRQRDWYRFRPTATFADPFLDAARALLVLDTCLWPAAARGHPENTDVYAPSLDVHARFHALAPTEEWLLVDAWSPWAGDGLVGGTGMVWSQSGRLLATGGQQMLCRPARLRE